MPLAAAGVEAELQRVIVGLRELISSVRRFTATRQERSRSDLEAVFAQARELLSLPGNDFSWSSWSDAAAALEEIDDMLSVIRSPGRPDPTAMKVLFLPTGPIQEVSISSGWGDEFLELARRFDAASRRFNR
jgi:hypothetical protein